MRLTPLRHSMLAFLAAQRTPTSLEMIGQPEGVRGRCNATTVYRTQMLFDAADIVRQIGPLRDFRPIPVERTGRQQAVPRLPGLRMRQGSRAASASRSVATRNRGSARILLVRAGLHIVRCLPKVRSRSPPRGPPLKTAPLT